MNRLTYDIIFDVIIQYLDKRSYCTMRQTCKSFKREIDERPYPFQIENYTLNNSFVKPDKILDFKCNKLCVDNDLLCILSKMTNIKRLQLYMRHTSNMPDVNFKNLKSLHLSHMNLIYDSIYKNIDELSLSYCNIEKRSKFTQKNLAILFCNVTSDDFTSDTEELILFTSENIDISHMINLKSLTCNSNVTFDKNTTIKSLNVYIDTTTYTLPDIPNIESISFTSQMFGFPYLKLNISTLTKIKEININSLSFDMTLLNSYLKYHKLYKLQIREHNDVLDLQNQTELVHLSLHNVKFMNFPMMLNLEYIDIDTYVSSYLIPNVITMKYSGNKKLEDTYYNIKNATLSYQRYLTYMPNVETLTVCNGKRFTHEELLLYCPNVKDVKFFYCY